MNTLPPPPHRIQKSVFTRAVFALLLAAGMTALMGWYVLTQIPGEVAELQRERALWDRGVPALDGTYDGKVNINRFVFKTFHLNVTYTDARHVEHTGKLEFSSLSGSIDDQAEGEIRYDPEHPDQFVLSKALDMSGSRWASILFFGTVCTGIIALFVHLAWLAVRQLRRTIACARDGQLVNLEVLSSSRPDRYGTVRYTFRVAGGPGAPKVHKGVMQKRAPLRSGPHFLGVQSRTEPDAVVMLATDGYPLDLPGDVRDALTRGA